LAELERNHDIEVEWLPYELRPDPLPLPDVTGADGARYRANWARGVGPLAEQFGVVMNFPTVKPRSRLAHEAAEVAREQGHFEAMRVALFQAYFVDNRDIGQLEVLLEIGREVGLDEAALRTALESGRLSERVIELEEVSRRLGVQAVPTIVIGDLGVEGVRPYEVLRRVLEQAELRAAGAGAS
jgi:predicted DsbA family dithiol-disulfide isomerase